MLQSSGLVWAGWSCKTFHCWVWMGPDQEIGLTALRTLTRLCFCKTFKSKASGDSVSQGRLKWTHGSEKSRVLDSLAMSGGEKRAPDSQRRK